MYARALIQRSVRLLRTLAPVLVLTACERDMLPTAVPPTHASLDVPPGCLVTSTADAGSGSLREKIETLGCRTIEFDLPRPATITLTSDELLIWRDVTINGDNANELTVARSAADGTPAFRIFTIGPDAHVSIIGITIANGDDANETGNTAGGIRNFGDLILWRSVVKGNRAYYGGGIGNYSPAIANIKYSLIDSNVARVHGGGIHNTAPGMLISNSTISRNLGAGVHMPAGSMLISHSTIVANEHNGAPETAGGIMALTSGAHLTLRSSIVATNLNSSGAPDLYSSLTPDVTYSLIGSPVGNGVTATPENHNLVGTAETPLDPKIGPLALSDPKLAKATSTYPLLDGSPAIDAGSCTTAIGTVSADDQRIVARPQGLTCDMGAYELIPSSISTTTALSISPSTQQYSDGITLSASITPASATGLVEFFRQDGAGWSTLGSVVVKDGAARLRVNEPAPAGTASYKAEFTGNGYTTSSATANLTVTLEDATIGYSSNNAAALPVSSPGGSLNAGLLTLAFTVKEKEPDIPVSPGTSDGGEIKNAALAVTLAPVGSGSSVVLTCTGGFASGLGYATRAFSCTNAGPIPVNTYEVQANVTGGFFTGTYTDAFTVFDPSLGFATGGGSFVLGGDKVNFGFTMKYGKNSTNLQGNFIAVRHHADGTVSRLKSNALGTLALGEDTSVPMGWTTFNGKANYTKWDATAAAYVTVGNQSFSVYAEDRDNPGTGVDRIWLGAPGNFAMPGTLATAKANTAALTGGGIAVPHKAAGGTGKK